MVRIRKNGDVEMSSAAAIGIVAFMFIAIAVLPFLLGVR